MYSRLKSSLLNHFHKSGTASSTSPNNYNGLSKEEKKRLRHSLAECQLHDLYETTDSAQQQHHHHNPCSYQHSASSVTAKPSSRHPPPPVNHAPLAPQEEYLDESTSSNSTFYSDLLASSFSSSGNSSFGGGYICDYEDTTNDSFVMPSGLPSLSWNVQYIGSFPISGSHVDNLGKRIDTFQPTGGNAMQNVELSISVLGVKISCEKVSSLVSKPFHFLSILVRIF
uniref:PID domain-containing protein n=1 Tax=Caenorhabditis tropicalis TaxID=1561998 RepID=A0A1I7TS39_9PELO